MRHAAATLLLTICSLVNINAYSEARCPAHVTSGKPGEKSLTSSELVHHVLLTTPSEVRPHLIFGDVEFILKCGTQEDAEEFFRDIRNKSITMGPVSVIEAGQNFVRVAGDDGFKPNLAAFQFNFQTPVIAIPQPGSIVRVYGTYSSYSREPFRINMTNSSFVF
jgi:hypothetical protein